MRVYLTPEPRASARADAPSARDPVSQPAEVRTPMPESQEALDDARDARIGQVISDYLHRRKCGQAEPEAELLADHPDLADDLQPHLAMLRDLEPPGAKIASLVAKGILEKSNDPQYPAVLGPYKVVDFIGRGGMGIVLEAHEESLDRTVALKLLRPELTDDASVLSRFTREAKAAAALRHPNIVTVYAVGEHGGTHFIAMEYIEGPTLAELIRDVGALPSELTREVFRQILSGLGAAHDAGLIHRDIKSSNILLDAPGSHGQVRGCHGQAQRGHAIVNGAEQPNDSSADTPEHARALPMNREVLGMAPTDFLSATVKIADFGLARMASGQTRMTLPDSILGTPEYMSPEQARGDENLDHRTDLYSAGVVLYEMLTGRVPFKADSPSAVIHQILHDQPPDPRTLSDNTDPHLASLALRLMAKKPEDRLGCAEEAVTALEAGQKVAPPPRPPWPWRNIVLGAAVLAVLVAGIWWAWDFARHPPTVDPPSTRKLPLTDVRVDSKRATVLLEWRGANSAPEVFHTFPDTVGAVNDVALVDPDGFPGNGDEVVVVGSSIPFDDDGNTLIALDLSAQVLWGLSLRSVLQWPDCEPPKAFWQVPDILAAQLDDVPGDELIVLASDPREYPTRISVLDPRSGQIRSTFWHFGDISSIRLVRNYFDDGRPAILALSQA